MKSLLPRLVLSFLGCLSVVRANDAGIIAAVRAADDERIAATIAADPVRLAAILADQLHYAHSSGLIDTKASYIDALSNRRSVYAGVDYKSRDFVVAAPGIVLMKGHAIIHAGNKAQLNFFDLNFLAVWREENGRWRFLAWQSCRNPAPEPTPAVPAPPEQAAFR